MSAGDGHASSPGDGPTRRRSMSSMPRRRAWWRPSTVYDVAVALVVVLATAVAALVVEDLLPLDGPVFGASRLSRWIALAAVGVALLAVVAARRWVYDRAGTLFYVQMLDESMRNLHDAAFAQADRRRMSAIALVRWCDLSDRDDGGTVDVVATVRELSGAVEAALNADRDDTGYTVAPNLLWPLALVVGASLTPARAPTLIELGNDSQEFPLEATRTEPLCGRADSKPAEPTDGSGRHAVWLRLAPSASQMDEGLFAGLGVNSLAVVGPAPDPRGAPAVLTEEQLPRLALEVADLLVAAKQAANEAGAELVVLAHLPKAVALALGWWIAQSEIRFFSGTHLLVFAGPRGRPTRLEDLVPMRVHPRSPTVAPDRDLPAGAHQMMQ